MKNWVRIFLISCILLGSTTLFAYWAHPQFNNAFDDLSASMSVLTLTTESMQSSSHEEYVPISTPEAVSIATTSADLGLSFIFPKEGDEAYISCTYQILSFQPSPTTRSLEAVLVDADLQEVVEPIASGLARENEIEPNSQVFDWRVGAVWPGRYYIEVSDINGFNEGGDTVLRSDVFTIRSIPEGIRADERERICSESARSSR